LKLFLFEADGVIEPAHMSISFIPASKSGDFGEQVRIIMTEPFNLFRIAKVFTIL
jgi:hypothetical protein